MSDIDTTLNLVSKIDRNDDLVHAAAFLQSDDGIITISGDRTVRVLLKRDGGHYWPTICEYLADSVLCMSYHAKSRRLFVGLANGIIQEFVISEDFNRLSHRRDYIGQIGRIRAISPSFENNDFVYSCGSSPQLMQHCLQTGVMLSSTKLGSWGMCLQVDEVAKFVFVGELNGFVTMLAATQNSLSVVKRVQRHSGCITRLLWDPPSQWLFSSSSDGLVCCWDFGGGTGDIFELRAHQSSVNALALTGNENNRLLLTCGDDGALLAWKMDDNTLKKRKSVPKWLESNECQACDVPFFWNWRRILQQGRATWLQKFPGTSTEPQRTVPSNLSTSVFADPTSQSTSAGTTPLPSSSSTLSVARQHHCRRCGQAICGSCSSSTSVLPLLGFESPVRVCSSCAKQISPEEITPLCSTRPFSTGHAVLCMDTRPLTKQLLTVGRDRVVKIWDAKTLFAAASGRIY